MGVVDYVVVKLDDCVDEAFEWLGVKLYGV